MDAVPTQGARRRPSTSTSSGELTSRETYQRNLSPRIPRARISSKRQPDSSPQFRRRSCGAPFHVALVALTQAPLRLLPIGLSRPLERASSAPSVSDPWRGERREPGRADAGPEARAISAACSLFGTGVIVLLSMRLSGVRWGTTAHRERAAAPPRRGGTERVEGEAVLQATTSLESEVQGFRLSPLNDVRLGSMTFGSSATPRGPWLCAPASQPVCPCRAIEKAGENTSKSQSGKSEASGLSGKPFPSRTRDEFA